MLKRKIEKIFRSYEISFIYTGTPSIAMLGCDRGNYLVWICDIDDVLFKVTEKFTQDWKGQWFACHTEEQAHRFAQEIVKR